MEEKDKNDVIDLREVWHKIWSRKKLFFKVWVITFILACVWILPQPRYYVTDVKLAPEVGGESVGGGLSSLASSFGIDLGGISGQDAIYPELYPDLFENPEFIVGLYNIKVTTKDGDVSTTYFDYIKNHQKKNPLTMPFRWVVRSVKQLFEDEDDTPCGKGAEDINPFRMNRKDYFLMIGIMKQFRCTIDNRTSVVSVAVTDQDPLVSATMADSVKVHLQDFIIRYRTSKVAEDMRHYQLMRDEAEEEYQEAMVAFSRYSDAHQNTIRQSYQSERDKLETQMALKQNALTAMEAQLQSSKVKLQEKTPAFTTLKSATVPVKPAGPKRVLFVVAMLILTTMGTFIHLLRDDLKKFIVVYGRRKG